MRLNILAPALLLAKLAAAAMPREGMPLNRRATTLTNPVIYQDYPDLDVFRIGDAFYYSSSTFAFSPGAPVLKSYDLNSWSPVSHSIPTLNFGDKYNLNGAGSRAYVKGVWASTLRYRASNDMFYWMGCIENSKTYIWTAAGTGAGKNNGEVTKWNWTARGTINKCYYDCGLFIDDDDKMYMAYGNTKIQVSQLAADGLSEVKSQQVYEGGSTYIEGARMYKRNGTYYIMVTKVASGEWVLKASNPFGPYQQRVLFDSLPGPLDNAGWTHQGGMVDTPDGKWYWFGFMDSYPAGRVPVVAPISWSSDGWPSIVKDGSRWGLTYPIPVNSTKTVPPLTGTDNFTGPTLSDEWEWNHNPDTSKFKFSGGLLLNTATVTDDLYNARNTLTRRVIGPKSHGTFRLDVSRMADGDRAGNVLFRDVAGYIAVYKEGSTSRIVVVNNLSLGSGWATTSKGSIGATGPTLPAGTTDVWLRIQADVTPAYGSSNKRQATFWYSTNGSNFTQLGPSLSMTNDWTWFSGYRYSVFNFATKALGGSVTVKSFTMENIK